MPFSSRHSEGHGLGGTEASHTFATVSIFARCRLVPSLPDVFVPPQRPCLSPSPPLPRPSSLPSGFWLAVAGLRGLALRMSDPPQGRGGDRRKTLSVRPQGEAPVKHSFASCSDRPSPSNTLEHGTQRDSLSSLHVTQRSPPPSELRRATAPGRGRTCSRWESRWEMLIPPH